MSPTMPARIVRITARSRHWAKNVERLRSAELAPLGESSGTVQLEIFAAVEMGVPDWNDCVRMNGLLRIYEEFSFAETAALLVLIA